MYSIYAIYNKTIDKVYIGQSSRDAKERWWRHKTELSKNIHRNQKLQNSWNKYGSDTFEFFIIYDKYQNKEEVDEAEKFYIKWYKDINLSYNLSPGGEGWSPHEETRQKISEANKGRKPSPQTTEAVRQAQKGNTNRLGKQHSEQTKQKIREARAKQVFSEEDKKKMSEGRRGKPHPRRPDSEETCRKRSETLTGHKGYWSGKVVPEEIKNKRAEALRKYYETHEHHSKGKTPWNKGISNAKDI